MVLSGKLHVYKWTCHMFPTVLVLFLSCRQPCHVHIQHILQSRRFRMTCIGGTYTHGEFSQASPLFVAPYLSSKSPAVTPLHLGRLNPSWAEGTALELWSEVGSWCSHEMRWAKMAGRCGSRMAPGSREWTSFPGPDICWTKWKWVNKLEQGKGCISIDCLTWQSFNAQNSKRLGVPLCF